MSRIDHRPAGEPPSKFRLDKANKKLAGVCAGIARHFDLNPTMVRLIFVIGTLVGFGSFLILYIAIALLAD